MSGNFAQASLFLIDTLFALYIVVMIVRCILQMVRADFYNPLSQFIWQVTNPPVAVLRRVIPRWRNIDVPAIVLVLLLSAINIALDLWLLDRPLTPAAIAFLAIYKTVRLVLYIYFWSILIQAILSWVSPGVPSPFSAVLWSINEPLLRPVRRVLPPLGGLDLTPLVVLLGIQFCLILIG